MPTVIQPDEEEEGAGTAGPEGRAASVIGVLGAGTMGAGIAQLAGRSGARTLLFDPIAPALESGQKKVREGLAREVERKRLSAADGDAAAERLEATSELADLAPCELVIEAAPERVELKHELFGSLSEIVSEECVLATNTSSLPVTAIAAGASAPERVVGMHFFNPAPVMRLLEVVAGERSRGGAPAAAHATGEAVGQSGSRAGAGPGLRVDRRNRPLGLRAPPPAG